MTGPEAGANVHVLAQRAPTPPPIDAPPIDWRAIAPELALLLAGVVVILWVAFWPRRRSVPAVLTLVGLAAAAGLTAWTWDLERVAFEGAFAVDGITRYARVVLLAAGALATLMAWHESRGDRDTPPETFGLLLLALVGMSLLAAAADLLVVFIALELLSLSLYVLAAGARRPGTLEASMKYFLLGAFSSAFLLYGIALVYGSTGTTGLRGVADAVRDAGTDQTLLLAGVALLAVGFCFKVAAVPFHMWTPDVYQGAPLPVTAFMAAGTKTAGFAVFLRVFAGALGGLVTSWRPVLAGVAVLTMVVGSVLAVVQTDLKRLLAYSSIAHAGFLLIGLVAATSEGVSAAMFYLLAYAFMVMGAFMVVQYGSRAGGAERTSLEDWRGFGRRHPLAGGLLALFLFSLAGIPPALSGFWAKYFVFQAGLDAGLAWLVVIGVLSSAVAAFFYLRVVVLTYLEEPAPAEAGVSRSPLLGLALAVAGLLTVAIGLAPQVLVDAARAAGRILA
jgi:NADH-quinone oxidoreductase subunit N